MHVRLPTAAALYAQCMLNVCSMRRGCWFSCLCSTAVSLVSCFACSACWPDRSIACFASACAATMTSCCQALLTYHFLQSLTCCLQPYHLLLSFCTASACACFLLTNSNQLSSVLTCCSAGSLLSLIQGFVLGLELSLVLFCDQLCSLVCCRLVLLVCKSQCWWQVWWQVCQLLVLDSQVCLHRLLSCQLTLLSLSQPLHVQL